MSDVHLSPDLPKSLDITKKVTVEALTKALTLATIERDRYFVMKQRNGEMYGLARERLQNAKARLLRGMDGGDIYEAVVGVVDLLGQPYPLACKEIIVNTQQGISDRLQTLLLVVEAAQREHGQGWTISHDLKQIQMLVDDLWVLDARNIEERGLTK